MSGGARPASAAALASLLTVGRAGCATVGPDYVQPDSALPAMIGEPVSDGGSGAEAVAPVPARWWTAYGDARLDALVASAQSANADVRVAAAQLEEAEAVLREVQAALVPSIDAGASATRSRVTGFGAQPLPAGASAVRDDRRLTASTSFEIDFWGRLRRGAEAARAQTLASAFARDVVALSVTTSTVQIWLALRALDAQIEVVARNLALRNDALSLAQARAAGGVASELDVHQARSAKADAAAQLLELRRQRRTLENQLGLLAASPGLRVEAGSVMTMPLPPAPPAGLPSSLLARRPDVRAAEQALVAANARIGVARAAMFPTITLTGLAGGQSAELADLLQAGARIWSIGFGLTLPIFDAGRLEARVEQAEARRRAALAHYQRALEGGFREVADALDSLSRTAAVEAELGTRVDAAREALRLSTLRYEAGYSGFLEVLDAQRTLNEAELAFVRNRQARLGHSVELVRALGGGWQP